MCVAGGPKHQHVYGICACMCVCMYMYVHMHMYMYMYFACTCICIGICVWTCTCICPYMHIRCILVMFPLTACSCFLCVFAKPLRNSTVTCSKDSSSLKDLTLEAVLKPSATRSCDCRSLEEPSPPPKPMSWLEEAASWSPTPSGLDQTTTAMRSGGPT